MRFLILFVFIFGVHAQAFEHCEDGGSCVYEECKELKKYPLRYFDSEAQSITCTKSYTNYQSSEKYSVENRTSIKVASFNTYYIGNKDYKSYAVVADIVNQWDIIAAQEIMAMSGAAVENNQAIDLLFASAGAAVKREGVEPSEIVYSELTNHYSVPGYIKLLKALQKLDSSWALFLSTDQKGGTGMKELNGFYYRRSAGIWPERNDYCDRAYGCYLKFTGDKALSVFRAPYVASFRAGDMSFYYASAHVRFGVPVEQEAIDALDEVISGCENCGSMGKKEKYRFAELKVVLDELQNLEDLDDLPVILAGDLNLEISQKSEAYWSYVLGDTNRKVYQQDLSSLSAMNGTISNYDHFILDPELFPNCRPREARAYNFAGDDETSPHEMLEDFLYNKPYYREVYGEYLSDQIFFSPKKKYIKVWKLTKEKVMSELEDFDKKLSTEGKTPYKAAVEAVSDHLPIYMECDI